MAIKLIPASNSSQSTVPATSIKSNSLTQFNNSVAGIVDFENDYKSKITPAGDFEKVYGIHCLLNSLRNLLLTPLGTYFFDPSYGSELYKKVFEQADDITQQEIIYEVSDRVKQFDPRIRITKVDVSFFSDQKGFRVNVYIQNNNRNEKTTIDFSEDEVGFSLES